MNAITNDARHQYLVDYLTEEFSRHPMVRVRVVPHSEEWGVTVRTEAREYFFPFEWAESRDFAQVVALVQQIKDVIGC